MSDSSTYSTLLGYGNINTDIIISNQIVSNEIDIANDLSVGGSITLTGHIQNGLSVMGGNINANNNKVVQVANATSDNDAPNYKQMNDADALVLTNAKAYADAQDAIVLSTVAANYVSKTLTENVGGVKTFTNNVNINGILNMDSYIDMNNQSIINLALTPGSNGHATSKYYVDGQDTTTYNNAVSYTNTQLANYVTLATNQIITAPKTISNYVNGINTGWSLTSPSTFIVGDAVKTGCIELVGSVGSSRIQATTFNLHIDSRNATDGGIYINYYANGNTYLNVANGAMIVGTLAYDANYKMVLDKALKTNAMKITGNSDYYGIIRMNTNKIQGLANGTLTTDAVNYGQMTTADTSTYNNAVSYTDSQILTRLPLSGGTMTGNINLNSLYKIINSSAPSSSGDLTNKNYVDNAISTAIGGGGAPSGPYVTTNTTQTVTGTKTFENAIFKGPLNGYIQIQNDTGTYSYIQLKDNLTSKYWNIGMNTSDNFYLQNQSATTAFYIDKTTLVMNMAGNTLTNTATPSASGDVTNKSYVDTADTTTYNNSVTYTDSQIATRLALTGGSMSGSINMNSNKITTLGTCTAGTDAANKTYVDSGDSTTLTSANAYTDSAITTAGGNYVTKNTVQTITASKIFSADINLNNTSKIKNSVDPTLSQDLCTKYYTDTRDTATLTSANSYADSAISTAISALPSSYVTLGTSQTVSGAKTFNSATFNNGLNGNITISNNAGYSYIRLINNSTGSLADIGFDVSNVWYIYNGTSYVFSIDTVTNLINAHNNRLINLGTPTASTDATTKTYVDTGDSTTLSSAQTYATNADLLLLPINGSRSMTGALNMDSHKISSLAPPTLANDASTKGYADSVGSSTLTSANVYTDLQVLSLLPLSGARTMTGALNMGSYKILALATPTLSTDATNKSYVDTGDSTTLTSAQTYTNTQLASYLALAGGTMTGALNMGSYKILALATPTLSTDATNKSYVDTGDSTTLTSAQTYTNTQLASYLQLAGGTLSGNLIISPLTANTLIYSNASKQLTSASVGSSLSFSAGSLNTIQAITTASSPSFTGLTVSGLTASMPVFTDASKNLLSSNISLNGSYINGVLPIANGGTNSSAALNTASLTGYMMVSSGSSIVEALVADENNTYTMYGTLKTSKKNGCSMLIDSRNGLGYNNLRFTSAGTHYWSLAHNITSSHNFEIYNATKGTNTIALNASNGDVYISHNSDVGANINIGYSTTTVKNVNIGSDYSTSTTIIKGGSGGINIGLGGANVTFNGAAEFVYGIVNNGVLNQFDDIDMHGTNYIIGLPDTPPLGSAAVNSNYVGTLVSGYLSKTAGSQTVSGANTFSPAGTTSFVNTTTGTSWSLSIPPSITLGTTSNTGVILLKGSNTDSIIQATNNNLHLDAVGNTSSYGIYLNHYSTNCRTVINPTAGNLLIGTSSLDTEFMCTISKGSSSQALKVYGNALVTLASADNVLALNSDTNKYNVVRYQTANTNRWDVGTNINTYDYYAYNYSLGTMGFFIKYSNNYVGIGTSTPAYQLELSTDSAAKPTTSTWTVSCDQRIKKNIVDADLDICYNTVKSLKLKYFEWDQEKIETKDKHSIGWIAQDVETVFPNAVETIERAYDIDNFKSLNVDQLYKVNYGATQKLIEKVEAIESDLSVLGGVDVSQVLAENELLKSRVATLESQLATLIQALIARSVISSGLFN